jgi:tetratricopeptide (TPR) repeat protein
MSGRKVVMISSTALDLPEHRDGIRDGCERAGFEPHMMEKLPAVDADAIKASLRMVDEADVYVGIFAYRYGHVPDGHDISITEMEYNRAVERAIPRLIFFIHEDHSVTGKDVETGPGAAKLKALKDRISKERVAAFFKSPGELRGEVLAALTTLAKQLDAAETVDAAASVVAKLHRKTSIPTPPDPYVAHPYTLLQSRDLVGRQAELNALTDWVTNPASPAFSARVFCFVAIGGMGKSALAWKWFNQVAPNEMKPLAGRLWWSFYESDATVENFINRALCYVSGQIEDAVRVLPWQEREAQLLQHLSDKPYLFVLDGLERILIAYHRMDASYLADDDYDKQTANVVADAVGLPASAAQSFVGQHRLRQAIDPRAGAFLQRLGQVVKSRILITTRLYPSELQLPTGYPRHGCIAYFLRGLSDDDALALWRALNVSGSRAELSPIFQSIARHPLLVQALASEVANYRKSPGDFARWRADHPQFDPTSLPLIQSRTHILAVALQGLSTRVHKVLHTLVSFRMPASYATLEALLVGPDMVCNSAQDLDHALTELEDRGLIGWDRAANRYDAHPIVRGVVWELADEKDQRAVYTALNAHFEAMTTPEWNEVENLAELAPAIERYHTLVALGRHDDAFTLFRDRLDIAAYYRLAAHRERIEWLERMFPKGVEALPALESEDAQSYTLNALALSYQCSGEPGRAVPLYERSNEIFERQQNSSSWQIGLSNLGDALHEVGALRNATGALRHALLRNHSLKDKFQEGVTLQNLGRLACSTAAHNLGHVALSRSRHLFAERNLHQWEGVATSGLAERSLWIGDVVQAGVWAERAWELAAVQRVERDFVRAAVLQGRVARGLGDLLRAGERLYHALNRARAANAVEDEIPALIAIADLELQRGRPSTARERLDDLWEAAKRGPYPLQQADAYNVMTEIALVEGDKPGAIDAAVKAFKAAWCDGPPYAYHWGLEKAKAHLTALGVRKPDMPPFDESKFEPLPEVEINPRDEYWLDPDKLD